ncbi:MAG: hypothetical protein PHS81_04030, partial [Candidatus Nanoarchaeia archaeon]|nr:hypothetical protein [Candidatus Nanoarchaeia archaeon]
QISSAVPLMCYTEERIIDQNIRQDPSVLLANEISACWNKFGAGRKDPLFPDVTFLCSKIVFISNDPEVYIDLMKVYSILYFNKTVFQAIDVEMQEFDYELDKSNELRFCISPSEFYESSNYLSSQYELNKKILQEGMALGNIDFNKNYLMGTALGYNLTEVDSEVFYQLSDSDACLSLKESALNLYFMKNDFLQTWNNSCFIRCNLNCDTDVCSEKCLNDCEALAMGEENSFYEKISPLPIVDENNEFNQSMRIYEGIFYIRFSDYPGHTLQMQEDFFFFPETGNVIVPESLTRTNVKRIRRWFDVKDELDPIHQSQKHDYILIAYEANASRYFTEQENAYKLWRERGNYWDWGASQ